MSEVTQYQQLYAQTSELSECCQDLLDCLERRDDRWVIIPGLNIVGAIINALMAVKTFKQTFERAEA